MIQIQTIIKGTTNNERTNTKIELCAKNSTEKSEIFGVKNSTKKSELFNGHKSAPQQQMKKQQVEIKSGVKTNTMNMWGNPVNPTNTTQENSESSSTEDE